MNEYGTGVPLIAHWPGAVPAGSVCRDLVDFSDFLPTITQAGGGRLPKDTPPDGYSFFPQLLGRKGRPREWAFLHHWKNGRRPEVQYQWARGQRYKLYRVVKGRNPKFDGKLFDVQQDPREKNPISPDAAPPAARAARQRLAKVLDGIKEHHGPGLPPIR